MTFEPLGLGFFIASEIARELRGRIEVESSADETRFIVPMTAVHVRP